MTSERSMARLHQSRVQRIFRRAGLSLAAIGLVLLTGMFAVAGDWRTISVASGVEIPIAIPGVVVLVVGLLLAWLNRHPSSKDSVETIDVRPVAEWVRAFERHQAELEFQRLSELNYGRAVAKRLPAQSHQQPAA